MEKARCNTELCSNLSPPLNNVKPSNFWGSHQNPVAFYFAIYRNLHDREPDEYSAVPKRVRDDYCSESFREEAVCKSPDRSGHHCRHNKHEIEFGYMDKPIYQSGNDEAYIRVPAGRETVLNASSPEDFLCRADNEEHQQRENHRVFSFFHSIY